MSEENFEEWDADFLDQLIQVEELALSKLPATTPSNTNTNTQYALSSFQQPQLQPPLNVDSFISYSPPRELSQRIPALDSTSHSLHAIFSKSSSSNDNDDVKDLEIQRLKSELGRVSKQLTELERECSQLQKDRNQKQGQIAIAASKNIDKNGVQQLKGKSLCRDCTACPDGVLQQLQNAKAINDQVGPQINIAGPRSNDIGVQVDLSSPLGLTKKLQGIWRSPRDHKLGGILISKLFSVCSLEFRVLFGFMSLNKSPKVMDCLAVGSCDAALQYHMQSDHNSEAAKVSHLYSVLTKISCGMMQSEALLQPLLELCSVENVAVVNGSLRILHVFLKHLLNLEGKDEGSALYSGTMSWARESFLRTALEMSMVLRVQKIN